MLFRSNIIFGAVIDERMQNDVKISVIATGFDQTRPLRRIDQPIYKRQVTPSAAAPVAQANAVAAVAAKPVPTPEEKKFDQDDLEVPSFLRRR